MCPRNGVAESNQSRSPLARSLVIAYLLSAWMQGRCSGGFYGMQPPENLKKGNNVTAPFLDTGNENIPRKKDRVQPCHTTAVVACMGEYTAHTQVRAANSGAFFFSRVRPYDIIASLSKTIVNVTKRYMEKTQFVLFCKNYSRGKMKQSLGMKGTLLSL
jgi:hypothetical protein